MNICGGCNYLKCFESCWWKDRALLKVAQYWKSKHFQKRILYVWIRWVTLPASSSYRLSRPSYYVEHCWWWLCLSCCWYSLVYIASREDHTAAARPLSTLSEDGSVSSYTICVWTRQETARPSTWASFIIFITHLEPCLVYDILALSNIQTTIYLGAVVIEE